MQIPIQGTKPLNRDSHLTGPIHFSLKMPALVISLRKCDLRIAAANGILAGGIVALIAWGGLALDAAAEIGSFDFQPHPQTADPTSPSRGTVTQGLIGPPPDAYPGFEASFAESGPSTYLVPLLPPADNALGQQGFVRVINRSAERGHVRIDAYDDTGQHRGRIFLGLRANETAHFNSGDLEDGNAAKGLARGVGRGEGFWRLRLFAELNIEVLAYVRTEDGFLTSMHDVLPRVGTSLHAGIFNPGRNINQVSRLRLINLGDTEATVQIRATDDQGNSPGSAVELAIPAGAARTVSAEELESGRGLDGSLGEGNGKWRLLVEPKGLVVGMSLLESPTGHLTNLSTGPVVPYEHPSEERFYLHAIPYLPAANDPLGRQGFVRVVNRSGGEADLNIDCFDGAGRRYVGSIRLKVAAGQTLNFNSEDLESGNPDKGLPEGIGSGPSSWRLVLNGFPRVDVYSYVRTREGFLTSMNDFVPRAGKRHHLAILNPGSNDEQVSRLRMFNSENERAEVQIRGIDGKGNPSPERIETSLASFQILDLTAAELESGTEDIVGALGDGSAKWQLAVESDNPFVQVMSLLESASTGIITNLSSVPRRAADVVLQMPEMDGAGEAIGSPVTAGDADGVATYALEGPHADAFDIDAATGQIHTKPGVVYDHDTQPRYWLIVVATGENGEVVRIGTRVDVNDVLELPGAPGPPTATSVTESSVRLRWAAPDNRGPPLMDYDYRYRLAGGGGDWTEDVDSTIRDTETIVTGLTLDAEYEVQVRAVNSDGPGRWSDSGEIRVWPPVPDVEVSSPWGLTHLNLDFSAPPGDFTSYCMTLSLDTEIYGDQQIFINLFQTELNQIYIYGGLQTSIDGLRDSGDGQLQDVQAGRGAIFSRWQERTEDALRTAPGGLFESSAGEADFISVRNELAWRRGSYRVCLRKTDLVEGEPLPRNFTRDDIAYGWGKYEHSWVRMEVTDLDTGETRQAGSLAFPGKTVQIADVSVIFVEVYGGRRVSVRDVPYFELTIRDVQVDGTDLRYEDILEIANPGGSHADAPVLAKTIYNRSEREFVVRIGAFAGKTGKVETPLYP